MSATAPLPAVDEALLRRGVALITPSLGYFKAEISGFERVPAGPALFVGNHNGNVLPPDAFVFLSAYYRARGFDDPLAVLTHDFVFRIPALGSMARRVGLMPANPRGALQALDGGRKVLVFPGGGWEATRPSRDRDRIDFAGRLGFVRLAMRAGVPIVPVVSAGAHDGWHVFTRGDRFARAVGQKRAFRMDVFPIALGLPTGLVVGPAMPHIPLPRPIIAEVLAPMVVPGDWRDRDALAAGYEEVTQAMQATLTRLAARLPGRG